MINSCWEKCDEKCAYMFNVYKNQLSRQTGSRNLTGPNMLPTIWYSYMTLVTKYQIYAIKSYWEKCTEKYIGRTEGRTDWRTEVKQYTPPLLGAGVWLWLEVCIIKTFIFNKKSIYMYQLISLFNHKCRYLDDIITLSNTDFFKYFNTFILNNLL